VALPRFLCDKQAIAGALAVGTLILLAVYRELRPSDQDYSSVLQNPMFK
jgi:hypothetical protein